MPNSSTVRKTADANVSAIPADRSNPSLFPSVPRHRDAGRQVPLPPEPGPTQTGIARLAASSPLATAKRGAEYFVLPARSILNRCDSERVPFVWTVNPYRGCEFGCHYCYARYTHEYMDLDGGDFERKIFVKEDVGLLAARELRTRVMPGEHIALGTATDPYQPAEREFGATRAILEEMAQVEGLSLSIITKSDQIVRDLDLLKRIGERSSLHISITVTTLRTGLARLLEPRAPRPDLRIKALEALRREGLVVGMNAMPILPGLNDREEDLDALAEAAKAAGSLWFSANVLHLMSAARDQFLPFIEKKFPRLAQRYREWYGRGGYAPESYRKEISERVAAIRKKHGFGNRPEFTPRMAPPAEQLTLALG